MEFGKKVTIYDQFSSNTYGYIIKAVTAPLVYKISMLQVKNQSKLSDVVAEPVDISTLLQYPLDEDCPDLAYTLESGIIQIFLKSSDYPYEDDTKLLIEGYRYPTYLTKIDSELDIAYGDLELFTALAESYGAQLQGKLIPQRVLDKIEYLKSIINSED